MKQGPLSTYRNDLPYPFCPGCGHGPILDSLDRALVKLQADPARVVIVSDIGCSGLSDQFFSTSVFHGLHGRSITYASGIKLARPDLDVIVIMGDGGTGIGGTHLMNAARRNIGITVLVMNNLNFGMTGGQHSTTTPSGAFTSTTPTGNLERPLDICATLGAIGASYLYRGTSFDKDLPDRIEEAIRTEGFSLLDIWEMCTAHYVPANKVTRKSLLTCMEVLKFATGVLQKRDAPEFTAAYRQARAAHPGQSTVSPRPIAPQFQADLDRRFNVTVAGSAGGKVRSAARLAGHAAILSDLWAAQRDDYPITVKSGHSLSELILSREEIQFTGVKKPDALLILTEDGLKKAARFLPKMLEDDGVFTLPAFAGVETAARVHLLDPARASRRVSRTDTAVAGMAALVKQTGIYPIEALEEAARQGRAAYVDSTLEAIKAGLEMLR